MSICEGVEKMKKMKGREFGAREKENEEEDVRSFYVKKGLGRVWLMELRVVLVI